MTETAGEAVVATSDGVAVVATSAGITVVATSVGLTVVAISVGKTVVVVVAVVVGIGVVVKTVVGIVVTTVVTEGHSQSEQIQGADKSLLTTLMSTNGLDILKDSDCFLRASFTKAATDNSSSVKSDVAERASGSGKLIEFKLLDKLIELKLLSIESAFESSSSVKLDSIDDSIEPNAAAPNVI